MRKIILLFCALLIQQKVMAGNFILISHPKFVNLKDEKQDFYVKELRKSFSKLMAEKKKNFSSLNENIFRAFFSEAKADDKKDCIVGGYLNKASGKNCGDTKPAIMTCEASRVGSENSYPCPTSTYGFDTLGNVKCAPNRSRCGDDIKYKQTPPSCIVGGYVMTHDLATETCGATAGIKAAGHVELVCDPARVGTENKYPCLPVQIYGYGSDGGVICVAENPKNGFYFNSCSDGATKYNKVASRNASKTIALNPENYQKLDEYLKEHCKTNDSRLCKDVIGSLSDAASYVGTAGSVDPEKANPAKSVK